MTYNTLTQYLFVLLGQIQDENNYTPDGGYNHCFWIKKLIDDMSIIQNAHLAFAVRLSVLHLDMYDLWMYFVYFSKDMYGIADLIRRQLGDRVWIERLKSNALQKRVVFQTTHQMISLHRKRIGCLYLAYNQRDLDPEFQKCIIAINEMLSMDIHYYFGGHLDEKDRRNITEIEHKLLILYLDTLMPLNILESCNVVSKLIALEQQSFSFHASRRDRPEWLEFLAELSGKHCYISSNTDCIDRLIQRALDRPYAFAKNRLLMLTYIFIFNIWGGLAYKSPVEGPLMMSLIKLLIPLTKRPQEGEEAKICLLTMSIWLRDLIMKTPEVLMQNDVPKDFLYNTAHGNGLILKTMQWGNYSKNFSIQIRIWNELIQILQDSFFDLSKEVLDEMAANNIQYSKPENLVKKMVAKNPLLFREFGYYLDVIQSFFEIWMEKIQPEKSRRIDVFMLRLWVYFNYVLFTIHFNFLQYSDQFHPMLMILSYSNILQGDFEWFDLRIFERIYPLMEKQYKMFCYFTNDGRSKDPNFFKHFDICAYLLKERCFRRRNSQKIYDLMDCANKASEERTKAMQLAIEAAVRVSDQIGMESWRNASRNEKMAVVLLKEAELKLAIALEEHSLEHPIPSLENISLDQLGKNTLSDNIKMMRMCLQQLESLAKDKSYKRFVMESNQRPGTAAHFRNSAQGPLINMLIRPCEFYKSSYLYRHFKSLYRKPDRNMQIMVSMSSMSY